MQAHVSETVLNLCNGAVIDADACVAAYLLNRGEIDAAAVRRVRQDGLETVVLQLAELRSLPSS